MMIQKGHQYKSVILVKMDDAMNPAGTPMGDEATPAEGTPEAAPAPEAPAEGQPAPDAPAEGQPQV